MKVMGNGCIEVMTSVSHSRIYQDTDLDLITISGTQEYGIRVQ
jgi:hypothetical protein